MQTVRGTITSVMPTMVRGVGSRGPVREGGYLFIKDADGVDRFAHRSELESGIELSEALVGLQVEFVPVVHPKGPRALSVRLCSGSPDSGPSISHPV